MERTLLRIKTFGCEMCGYDQDFNALDEPQKHARLIPGIPAGKCPACFTGQTDGRVVRHDATLSKIVDLSKMATTTSAGDDELAAREVVLPKMQETGKQYQLNPKAGVIEQRSIMEPTKRPVDSTELATLKEQRDWKLDELSKSAVKKVSAQPSNTRTLLIDNEIILRRNLRRLLS